MEKMHSSLDRSRFLLPIEVHAFLKGIKIILKN